MGPRSRAPGKQEFEFFGPYLGPIGIPIATISTCFALYHLCGAHGCASLLDWSLPPAALGPWLTWQAVAVYLGWLAFQIALHLLLPGQRVQGVPLPNGQRLTYKFTGLKNFYVTLALVLGLGFATDVVDLGWAADNYLPLMTCGVLFSVSLSVVLFAASHAPWRRGVLMARGADTGYTAYDWYMGRELNPRIGGFDVKQFVELIPGLLGWMVLDLAMARKQLAEQGRVSGAMALVCAFQGLYVWDALQHESAILTTMDITTDGLGYMLAFGNLAWVPFTYSLQARVLLRRSPRLSTTAAAALVLLKGLGYAMFRGSNNQKDQFRRDPTDPRVAKLQSMPTQRGTRLLTSGWWGMSRHPNYLGDWIMAWAWCLPCGLGSGLVPYFYVIYFAVLLVHRALRDDHACRQKYGADWPKYCKLVRWRIIPFVY